MGTQHLYLGESAVWGIRYDHLILPLKPADGLNGAPGVWPTAFTAWTRASLRVRGEFLYWSNSASRLLLPRTTCRIRTSPSWIRYRMTIFTDDGIATAGTEIVVEAPAHVRSDRKQIEALRESVKPDFDSALALLFS